MPDFSQALMLKADANMSKGDFVQAEKDFAEALDINPDNIDAYMKRALLFIKTEQYEKALPDIEEIMILDDKNAYAYLYKAIVFRNMGKFSESLKNYDAALKIFVGAGKIVSDTSIFEYSDYYSGQNANLSDLHRDIENRLLLNSRFGSRNRRIRRSVFLLMIRIIIFRLRMRSDFSRFRLGRSGFRKKRMRRSVG